MKIYSLTEVLNKLNMHNKSQLQRRLGYKSTGTMTKWGKEGIPPAAMIEIMALPEWEDEAKKADHSPIVEAIIGKVESLTDAEQGEAYAILSKHFSDALKKEKS